jgi:hypothetical protein
MRLRHLFAFVTLVLAGAAACGGGNKDGVSAKTAENQAIDADPIALLPSAAMAISRVDAKQMFTSGSVGGQIALMAEHMLPVGEEAGFNASRDLETVYSAAYSTSGADVVAILRGTFDEQKIKSVADSHTPTKAGGVLVSSSYLGRQVYTLSNVGFTVISKQTVVAGSETMIRRVIERMKDGTVQRSQPPWMIQTIETPNAAFAAAADFANQPIAAASIGMVPLGWVKGMKAARLVGNFKDPGLNIAATLTFPDKASAADAAEQVKRTAGMASLLQFIGAPQLKNLDVKPVEGDVQVSFGVDDGQLKTFLQTAQSYMAPK